MTDLYRKHRRYKRLGKAYPIPIGKISRTIPNLSPIEFSKLFKESYSFWVKFWR